jgi:hypothetical protein
MSKDQVPILKRQEFLSLAVEASNRINGQQWVGRAINKSQAQAIGKIAHFLLDHAFDWPMQLDYAMRYVLRSTPVSRERALVVLAYVKSERFQKESLNRYTTEFVEEIYQIVHGRMADDNGMRYWAAQINTGKLTRMQAIGAMIASEEFRISHNLPEWRSR